MAGGVWRDGGRRRGVKKKSTIAWDAQASAGQNARLHLKALVAEFFALGREAASGHATPEALHAFRLAAKRFRYTLELFQPLYGTGLKAKLEAVRQIQSILGDRQDDNVLAARIRDWMAPSDAVLGALTEAAGRGVALEGEFVTFWRDHIDKPGAEGLWARYFQRGPAVPGPAKRAGDSQQ